MTTGLLLFAVIIVLALVRRTVRAAAESRRANARADRFLHDLRASRSPSFTCPHPDAGEA